MHGLKIISKYVCPVNGAIGIHPACSDPWTKLLYESARRCNPHVIVITPTAQIMQIFQNNLFKIDSLLPIYQSFFCLLPIHLSDYAFLAQVTNLSFENVLVCMQAKDCHLLQQSATSGSPTWLICLILVRQHASFFIFRIKHRERKITLLINNIEKII